RRQVAAGQGDTAAEAADHGAVAAGRGLAHRSELRHAALVPGDHLHVRLLGEQLERLATVVGDLVRDQGGGLHRGPTSIARSYALTVSRPQRSQEKWSSAVSRAASPRAPSS